MCVFVSVQFGIVVVSCVMTGVQVAARSLIQLFREKNPHLLHHKYRVAILLLLLLTFL